MTNEKIAVVIGAGPNVGAPTVDALRQRGYLVAYTSRSATSGQSGGDDGRMPLKCDCARPRDVEEVFRKVREAWGEASVVIYNAYSAGVIHKEPAQSLSLETEAFEHDLAVNTTSAFVAAREAVEGFQKLPPGPKSFLYTANATITRVFPRFLALGLGKVASAHFVELADSIFHDQDIRFLCVDEREADGQPMFKGVNGQAHADLFMQLIERTAGDNLPWYVTFVKDRGYVKFPDKVIP